jgi:hypothetical protein
MNDFLFIRRSESQHNLTGKLRRPKQNWTNYKGVSAKIDQLAVASIVDGSKEWRNGCGASEQIEEHESH